MVWPTPQDYNEALQNPAHCFFDEELAAAEVRCDRFGMPRPETGNFASVYRLSCSEKTWAVRCFLHQIADREKRYKSISSYINAAELPFFLPFIYLPDGIRIGSETYPIVKMEYLDACSFSEYMTVTARRPEIVGSLIRQLETIAAMMQERSIAHGDLQHDNILVNHGKLFLVDYDAMFVPELKGMTCNEMGHHAYQHPGKRLIDFNQDMDNFPFWLLSSTLSIVAAAPDLLNYWGLRNEGLLFSHADLQDPSSSALFQQLEEHEAPAVREASHRIRAALQVSCSTVPALSDSLTMQDLLESTPDLPAPTYCRLATAPACACTVSASTGLQAAATLVLDRAVSADCLPGKKQTHQWPEPYDNERSCGYPHLEELLESNASLPGEVPFLPPIILARLEEQGVILALILLTTCFCGFLCPHPITVLVALAVGAIFAQMIGLLQKHLTDREALRTGPRGRFLSRVSDLLFDGKCYLARFRFDGPPYDRAIVFESGVPDQLLKKRHRISNRERVCASALWDLERVFSGMLYLDVRNTEAPLALCAEGNILIWFI
jgi:hypothetical protein